MTRLKATVTLTTFVLAVLLPAVLTRAALAQSEADLRRQNQELQARVKDLEAELAAARTQAEAMQKRIGQLEQALAAARSGGGRTTTPPPEEPEKVTVDESKPDASPRALFNAVVESYKKAVGESPIGNAGDRDRVAYMRKLEKWGPAVEREFRLPVEWHVRLQSARVVDAGRIATFIAVDPVTDVHLGDPFDVALSRSLAGRLADLEARGDVPLLLKGTIVLNVILNENRESRGSFNNPPFIGPFAEFEFTVDSSSITLAPPPPATQPASTTKPAAPANGK